MLSPSIRGEALVTGGYQIAFQANIAYELWFVDGRPRDTIISRGKDLQIFALDDGFFVIVACRRISGLRGPTRGTKSLDWRPQKSPLPRSCSAHGRWLFLSCPEVSSAESGDTESERYDLGCAGGNEGAEGAEVGWLKWLAVMVPIHQNEDSAMIASGGLSGPPKKLWTTIIPIITHASAAASGIMA